jgi:tetratricopeptide (TPR) repeat protein
LPVTRNPQLLEEALAHHRAERLQRAQALYQQILALEPHQADALHFLGVIAHQNGRLEAADDYLSRAIRVNPRGRRLSPSPGTRAGGLRKDRAGAGAPGVPVWAALPYAPDWRWLLGRDDSPWYPTMRALPAEAARGLGGGVRRNRASAARTDCDALMPQITVRRGDG